MRYLKPVVILLLTTFIAQEALANRSKRRKKKRSVQRTSQYEDQNRSEDRSSDGSYVVEETTTVYESSGQRSSAAERSNKIVSLTGGILSGSAGIYVHKNVILGAKYVRPFITLGAPNLPTEGHLFSGFADIFIGNTFYVTGGYGQRTLVYDDIDLKKSLFVSDSKGRVREVTYTDTGATIGVGNRWQWKNFSIGAEWVGLYFKVTEPEVSRNFKGDFANIYDDILQEKKKRDELTNPSLTSTFYVGLSF